VQVQKIERVGDAVKRLLHAFDQTARKHVLVVPAGCGAVTTAAQFQAVIAANNAQEHGALSQALGIRDVRLLLCFVWFLLHPGCHVARSGLSRVCAFLHGRRQAARAVNCALASELLRCAARLD
jgi:hypothetical protein